MDQVEIAESIIRQGNCINVTSCKLCQFRLDCKSDKFSLKKVNQWLKEQGEKMIDLTVNQIVDPPVKCWVMSAGKWVPRWLLQIDDGEYCIINSTDHSSSLELSRSILCGFTWYKQCSLTDPNIPKTKPWERAKDVPFEVWGSWYKQEGNTDDFADILTPCNITYSDGMIDQCLVWCPKSENPIGAKWRKMESEAIV